MIIHTVMPLEIVFEGMDENIAFPTMATYRGLSMMVTPTRPGRGKIERLISTDPMDYLRPDCQPGKEIALST